MKASTSPSSMAWSNTSEPRIPTVTLLGSNETSRPGSRLRLEIVNSCILRSTGAGTISTVTSAELGVRSRNTRSDTPIVTKDCTRSFEPSIDTGSVIASTTLLSKLVGPTISTDSGTVEIRPTANPSAGCPSMSGTTGTVRGAPAVSSAAVIVEGIT